MNALAKLLNKLELREQANLLEFLRAIKDGEMRKSLDVKKFSGSDFYRARKGKFRVIFHLIDGHVAIDAVRLRNEKTYRDF